MQKPFSSHASAKISHRLGTGGYVQLSECVGDDGKIVYDHLGLVYDDKHQTTIGVKRCWAGRLCAKTVYGAANLVLQHCVGSGR